MNFSHFIKTILLLSISILTACSTHIEKVKSNDVVQAFLVDKDNLYVVGQNYDYQFSQGNIDVLQKVLMLPFINKMKDPSILIEIHDGKKLKGYYDVSFVKEQLSKKEQKVLMDEYGFTQSNNGRTLFKRFYADGILSQLQNRNELLSKYPLTNKLSIQLEFFEKSKKITGEDIAKVVLLPVAIPVAVVGTVLAFPIYFIWVVAESAHK